MLNGLFEFTPSNADPTNLVLAGVVSVSGPNISQPNESRKRRMDNHYDIKADYKAYSLSPAIESAKKTFRDNLKQSYTSALQAALLVHDNSHANLTVILPLLSSGIYGGNAEDTKDESRRISYEALKEVLETRNQAGVTLNRYFDSVILAVAK